MSVDANVLITFLSFFGKEPFFALSIPTSFNILMTYFTAVIVQFFLCHLYFIITRKRVISLCLALLALVHLGFSFAAAVMIQTAPLSLHLTWTITAVGAVTCGVNDLLIAGCLGYELFKMRPSNSSKSSLLRRIFILSITSGAIVASTTLLMMILFLKGSIGKLTRLILSCQGRIYALTLLFNFLSGFSSSSSSVTSPSSDQLVFQKSFSSGHSKQRPPPSIYSNFSEDSLNKELPPLPTTSGLQIISAPQIAGPVAQFVSPSQFASVPSSVSSSRVVGSPRTPQTPRTIIVAPYRIESLPQTPKTPKTPRTIIAAPYRVDSRAQ
ncbi:hypothetical protein B0H13DRAFT_2377947 [Mycena leptocephala]|nr:hypothetical protein B0H13DRAFT_2377947 [Mycena leptocephala]